MDIRIGITQAARELTVEIADEDKTIKQVKAAADAALSGTTATLVLTDKRGRQVMIPSAKIAYVEFGAPDGDRKLGFGS